MKTKDALKLAVDTLARIAQVPEEDLSEHGPHYCIGKMQIDAQVTLAILQGGGSEAQIVARFAMAWAKEANAQLDKIEAMNAAGEAGEDVP